MSEPEQTQDVVQRINTWIENKLSKGKVSANEILNHVVEISKGKPAGGYAEAVNTVFRDYGVDAEQNVYKIKPEDHIDNRELADVGKRNVKAFQYQHPEIHEYYIEAANMMLNDLRNSMKGERSAYENRNYSAGSPESATGGLVWTSVKRSTSAEIAELLDDWGASYDTIETALQNIIENHGQEKLRIRKAY